MHAEVFTVRDLEQVRGGRRLGDREPAGGELRSQLATFLLLAACWLARELLFAM